MISVPDQSFWLICIAFYLADHFRLHSVRHLLFAETWNGGWKLLRPIHRFRIAGRAVTIIQPFTPFLAAVQLNWLVSDPFGSSALRRTNRLLQLRQARLAPFRVLSGGLFLVFFVAGPVATEWFGLGYAMIMILPIHLTALVFLSIALSFTRRTWLMQWSNIVVLVFECAVCPGYFVNVCRKVSLGNIRVPGDAIAFCLLHEGREDDDAMAIKFELLLEDFAEDFELDEQEIESVSDYRARLTPTTAYE